MTLTVNGETRQFDEAITLESLLNELEIRDKVMAAAVNMNIVKQEAWSEHQLEEGDKLELLDFVGGG